MSDGEGDPGAGVAVVSAAVEVVVISREVVPAIVVEVMSATVEVAVVVALDFVVSAGEVSVSIVMDALLGTVSIYAVVIVVAVGFAVSFDCSERSLAIVFLAFDGGLLDVLPAFAIDGASGVSILVVASFYGVRAVAVVVPVLVVGVWPNALGAVWDGCDSGSRGGRRSGMSRIYSLVTWLGGDVVGSACP